MSWRPFRTAMEIVPPSSVNLIAFPHQIRDNPHDHLRITKDQPEVRIVRRLEGDALFLGIRLDRFGDAVNQSGHVDLRLFEGDASGSDRRHVQQVADHVCQSLRVGVASLELGTGFVAELSPDAGQGIGEHIGDGCEWRTELVGDDRDEVVLGLILDKLSS